MPPTALNVDRERVSDLAPGDVLGRYRLLLPIASGGMGRVWAARQLGQRGIRKLVGVKTALAEFARLPEFEKLFMDEARIAAALEHPNVCRVLEVGDEGGVLYLAMEWLGGGSLRQLFSALPNRRLDPRIAACVIAQACSGLHAAHELCDDAGVPLGVVHRDVSPHNLLLTVDGHVKVADFGVARARDQLHQATNTGEIKGKLSYMAPEQLASKPYDRRADIFALGCVLYEALVGTKPFEGEGITAIYNIIEGRFSPPNEILPVPIPEELQRIVMCAMARDPAERFLSADAMRSALERWLAASGEPCTEADVRAVIKSALGAQNDERAAAIRMAESAVASVISEVVPVGAAVDDVSGSLGPVHRSASGGAQTKAESERRLPHDGQSEISAGVSVLNVTKVETTKKLVFAVAGVVLATSAGVATSLRGRHHSHADTPAAGLTSPVQSVATLPSAASSTEKSPVAAAPLDDPAATEGAQRSTTSALPSSGANGSRSTGKGRPTSATNPRAPAVASPVAPSPPTAAAPPTVPPAPRSRKHIDSTDPFEE